MPATSTKPSSTRRLEQLAKPLRPARAPYYMRAEERPPTLRRTFPATGWYWRPRGAPVAVYLGRNYDEARDALLEHLHALEHDDEDGER